MTSNINRLFKSLSLAMTVMLPYSSAAEEIHECRLIDSDLDRLACYDRASGRTPEKTDVQTSSSWNVSVEKSEMTDDTNVFVSVASNEAVNCGWSTQPTTLMLRCKENTTSAYFVTGCHMTASEYNSYGQVTYRIDDANARTKSFEESTNNRSLGLWRGRKSIPFIKELIGHDRLLARMTPYGENAFTVDFNIAGLDNAIAPLRKACNW